MADSELREKIKDFIDEMSGFAKTAEDTLSEIESDLLGKKHLFSVFSERMFTIRGTADQLKLSTVSKIAGLGEEIAIKATDAEKRPHVRKCVGALWDALTTVKHLLVHYDKDTGEEEDILVNRLEKTLEAFGGARETLSQNEIEAILAGKN